MKDGILVYPGGAFIIDMKGNGGMRSCAECVTCVEIFRESFRKAERGGEIASRKASQFTFTGYRVMIQDISFNIESPTFPSCNQAICSPNFCQRSSPKRTRFWSGSVMTRNQCFTVLAPSCKG